tara:strand:- start:418 stop:597 length:180 start_codon:yes stop_codon:yes gene_type:complete
MKTAIGIIQILIVFPIRFYLTWYVLTTVNATELPMFMFWVSIPLAILLGIIGEVIKHNK